MSAQHQLSCVDSPLSSRNSRILSRLRAAAGPDTKLLIGDMLLPFACHDDSSPESSFALKDSPLLPNLGKGNVHGYLIDIMVSGEYLLRESLVPK